MKVSLLIQQSYRDAQLVAEEGETATGTQLQTGLTLLNRILRMISIDGYNIPLFTEETLNLSQGTPTLDLAGWAKIEKLQYLLGNVLFNIKLLDFNDYYNNAVIPNSQGIPYIAYAKRDPTGNLLRVFLNPSENYTIFVKGFKVLPTVALTDTIDPDSTTGFMEDYIGYRLSVELQVNAQIDRISPWLILKAKQYESAYKRLKPSRIDVTVNMMGTDDSQTTQAIVSWNLGQGWNT